LKEISKVMASKAIEKVTTTYSSFNLVSLVRVAGNSPVRLLALRMLQSPDENLRPIRRTLMLNYYENHWEFRND
jgi:hypothetical protein